MTFYYEDWVDEAKEHKACFGKYYDEYGLPCEDGSSGLCSYCVECQQECIDY